MENKLVAVREGRWVSVAVKRAVGVFITGTQEIIL